MPETSNLKINSASVDKNKEFPIQASQSEFDASGNDESISMPKKFPASKLETTSVKGPKKASNKTINKGVKRKTIPKASKREIYTIPGNVSTYEEHRSSSIGSIGSSRRSNGKKDNLTIENNKNYDELQAIDYRSTEKQVPIGLKKRSKLRDKQTLSLDKPEPRTGIIRLRNKKKSEISSSPASSVAEVNESHLKISQEHVDSARRLRRAEQDMIGTKKPNRESAKSSVTRKDILTSSRPEKSHKEALVARTTMKGKLQAPLRIAEKKIEISNPRKRSKYVNDETIRKKKRKKYNDVQLQPESSDDNGEGKWKDHPRTSVRKPAENVASNTPDGDSRKIIIPVIQKGISNSQKTSTLPSSKDMSHYHNSSKNDSDDNEPLPYQKLTAVTRYVSQHVIEKKWRAMPSNYVEHISILLKDIEKDVIYRLGSKRRTEIGLVLQQITRKLITKLSNGALFPISHRKNQENFNFEKILDKNQLLENHLTPILHTNELLETEVNKELAWLEVEKEKLGELEINAKTERVSRNEASRKLHAVLQKNLSKTSLDLEDQVGLEFQKIPSPSLSNLEVSGDDDLISLVKDIYGHVESLQRNAKQVSGISEMIARSRATLQATLFDQLDQEEFERIIMGI
ncbi:BgTH12-03673 [Blumeria graminis f. sp. triticale]|uniref:BgTH12-03673 n=1 Tax=Blumeria graminis f. sp. triticale TaxID=1689686 RepID=A0A9W4D075_BLUGR|nr:BgTH12-03673 [Blumeria graminis f. sp. triticale]